MNVVDSTLRLEYFADTEAGNFVAETIENTGELLVPTITLYEVFKKLLLERMEEGSRRRTMRLRLKEKSDN